MVFDFSGNDQEFVLFQSFPAGDDGSCFFFGMLEFMDGTCRAGTGDKGDVVIPGKEFPSLLDGHGVGVYFFDVYDRIGRFAAQVKVDGHVKLLPDLEAVLPDLLRVIADLPRSAVFDSHQGLFYFAFL